MTRTYEISSVSGATSNPDSCDLEDLECPGLDSDQVGLEAIRFVSIRVLVPEDFFAFDLEHFLDTFTIFAFNLEGFCFQT
jgi:hypothetical protein